jgi:uncharacterized protein YkwD
MNELHHPKIFISLFLGALGIALGILFHEQGIRLHAPSFFSNEKIFQEAPSLEAHEAEVAPLKDTSPGETSPLSRSSRTEYSDNLIADHLALTPANIIWMTNYERVQQGMEPFSTQPLLNNSAHAKNEDMHLYGYMNHTFAHDGISYGFDLFIKKQSYEFLKIGENLAEGDFQNTYELVQAWMRSPEHRKNILDHGFRDIGVSVFMITNPSGTARAVYVQHFGVAQSMCPHKVLNLQDQYHQLEEQLTLKKAHIETLDPNQQGAYQQEIDSYNELIQRMNTMVQDINSQIRRYNQCVEKFL